MKNHRACVWNVCRAKGMKEGERTRDGQEERCSQAARGSGLQVLTCTFGSEWLGATSDPARVPRQEAVHRRVECRRRGVNDAFRFSS